MAKIRKFWVSREELTGELAGIRTAITTIDAGNVGGLTAGSIPFADAGGWLAEDNAALFWDAAEKNLGIGTATFGATMTQGVQIATGLAPTANVVDTFAFYSDDFVAGNACPHFRTENGTVIGLNQSLFTTDNVIFGTIGCGTITVANGASINLQEDITFTGATGVNLIKFPDNLPDALSFMEGANPYMTFVTTNGSEAIHILKKLGLGIANPDQLLHLYGIGATAIVDASADTAGLAQMSFVADRPTDGERTMGAFYFRQPNVAGSTIAAFEARVLTADDIGVFVIRTNDGVALTDRLRIDQHGNIGVGAIAFGANAERSLGIAIGTEPAASLAGQIEIYAKDSSDGAVNATLAFRTEQGVEVIGTFTPSHKLKIWINGVEYWVQLDAV